MISCCSSTLHMRILSNAISKSLTLRLLTLVLSYSVSLLIFQRGLLVKRLILPHRSSCQDIVGSDPQQCWTEARFNKVILLVIDALRFDFIYPSLYGKKECSSKKYYIGQMPLVSKLLNSSNAGLFALLSDAPTTTFQRIKALVTGSVPAFIEASDNFGGSEIQEDNLIDQLVSHNQNVSLLGDDTWLNLLPGRFNRHFVGPSFDIKDLDTVDDIVISHIYDELNQTDWSLLIAHCLGVDHAGHRYGPTHPEMARKLGQMDQLVHNITSKMPQDAILLVIGDHGMTQTGDHGGDSVAETTSALFFYAPKLNTFTNISNVSIVHQIDLVPTLALLLDVPIPFSSIGLTINSLLSGNSLNEFRLNSFQMIRYAQHYFVHQPQMQEKVHQIIHQHENAADDFQSNVRTIKSIQKLLRLSFDQFHFSVCVVGLISLLESICFNGFLLMDNAEEWISVRLWVFRSALLFLQLSLVFADEPTFDIVIFSVASLAVSLFSQTMVLSYRMFRAVIYKHFSFSPSFCLTLLFNFVLSLLPLSNSFIIYESDILRFFLQSIIFILLLCNLYTKRPFNLQSISEEVKCAFVLLILTRFLKQFERCREEQVGCLPFKFAKGSSFLVSVLFALGVVWILFEYSHSDRSHSLTKAFVWSMVVLLILHWAFELSAFTSVESMSIEPGTPKLEHNRLIESISRRLAQFVYLAFFGHLFLLRWLQMSFVSASNSWVRPHFQSLVVPLMMLSGYSYGLIISVIVVVFVFIDSLASSESVWTNALLLHLIGLLSFYATGHHQTLNSIPWHAAFIGLPGNFPFKWLSAFFIFVNMFSGKILVSLLAFAKEEDRVKGPFCLLLFGGMRVFGSSLAALIHHKHLMFFKVFAPKFVFEAADFVFCCALILFWTILRVKETKS